MRHLTPDQLVDLAEGVGTEPSMPHLRSCEVCRTKLAELRAMLSAAAEVDVPEPSPLFWDHFSARVHQAVAAERTDAMSGFWRRPSWRSAPLWFASLAVAVLAVLVLTRGSVSEAPHRRAPSEVVAESQGDVPAIADDASLSLVADLVTGLDWDAAVDAGLAADVGIADDVVTQLSDGERRELHQLLRIELGVGKVQGSKFKGQSKVQS